MAETKVLNGGTALFHVPAGIALRFMICLVLLFPAAAMAQGISACFDSTSSRAKNYRYAYSQMVSDPDTAAARQRTNLGLPLLTASQVRIVGDTTLCRRASVAYDSAAALLFPDRPVILLELGPTRRIVIKDIGAPLWLNLLFDATLTLLFENIGY